MRRGLVALVLVACNGQLPLMEADDPAPVPDAARPAPPTAPVVPDAARPVDAGADAVSDATPAADGGPGFRIVAGAAIIEAVAERRPDRPRGPAPESTPSVAAGSTPPPAAPRLSPMQTIRAHQGDVSTCYGRVALKDPTIRGRITVQWTIGRDGTPMAVAIIEDTLKDKSVGACIKEKARAWRFPPPGGGVQVISYPFDLRVQ